MFPLSGTTFPTDGDELAAAIEGALAEVLKLKKAHSPVSVVGRNFPDIKQMLISLDGACVELDHPPPQPKPTGKRVPGITVEHLGVSGHPIQYEKSKLDLDLTARGVAFDFAKDKSGRPLLVLKDAEQGSVEAKMSKADLQSALLAAATAAAKTHGVTIQDLQIDLTSETDRSLAADVKVKAKKLMMSGTVHVTGKLDLDDDLNATLSNLNCTGEGMIGGMAASFLQSQLKKYNGKKFPLMAFSLGDATLRDLQIRTKPAIQVSASFGRKAQKSV